MKKLIIIFIVGACLIAAGLFVPLGSFTSSGNVCTVDNPPVVRLDLIKGETLQKERDADNIPSDPGAGCSMQANYVLYAL